MQVDLEQHFLLTQAEIFVLSNELVPGLQETRNYEFQQETFAPAHCRGILAHKMADYYGRDFLRLGETKDAIRLNFI